MPTVLTTEIQRRGVAQTLHEHGWRSGATNIERLAAIYDRHSAELVDYNMRQIENAEGRNEQMNYIRITVHAQEGADIRYSQTLDGVKKWHKITRGTETIIVSYPHKIVYTTDHDVLTLHIKSENGDALNCPINLCAYCSVNSDALPSGYTTIGGHA